MSERTQSFLPVTASGIRPPEDPILAAEGLVLGPWVARRSGAHGSEGSLLSRRGNLATPTLILTRRRRPP